MHNNSHHNNNSKIIQDANTLLFDKNIFYETYKDDIDYIDVLTYANVCELIKNGDAIDPVATIIDYMLTPNQLLHTIDDVDFPPELLSIFTRILKQQQLTIDLSILYDDALIVHEFQNSSMYILDQLAAKFELEGKKLFMLNGQYLNTIVTIGVLPQKQFYELIQHNSSQLSFNDYFTSHPLRKGKSELEKSVAAANKHNSELIIKLDEYDKSQQL